MIDSRDERLGVLYTSGLSGESPAGHPAPASIAAVVERRGPEADRLEALGHIAECAQCRREFDLLRSANQAGRELVVRSWRTRGIGLAAAAVLVVGASLSIGRISERSGGPAPADRSAGTTAGGAKRSIELVEPLNGASMPSAPQVIWRAVGGGAIYRVEVTDDAGAVVASRETRDTVLTLPSLAPGRTYRWWVRALVAGQERRSVFGEFRTNP
jgi:hypothetical protein